MRSDGQELGINYKEPGYDRAATQKLVDDLRATGGVTQILFNDPEIKGAKPYSGHDDHLHVVAHPSYRRPVRTDGKQFGIRYDEPGYDRQATQALVNELLATGGVESIFFNEPEIKGATYQKKHDNHLHVRVKPNWKR